MQSPLDLHPVPHLGHRHARHALQQFGHHALVGRVQVLDDDKGHAAVGRHVTEKVFEGLQSAGRSTDADDREALCAVWRVAIRFCRRSRILHRLRNPWSKGLASGEGNVRRFKSN